MCKSHHSIVDSESGILFWLFKSNCFSIYITEVNDEDYFYSESFIGKDQLLDIQDDVDIISSLYFSYILKEFNLDLRIKMDCISESKLPHQLI